MITFWKYIAALHVAIAWALGIAVAGVVFGLCLVLALSGCGARQRVLTDAEYFACNQEGLTIIADQGLTCPQVLAGLDKLVADKPECQQVFKGDRTGMSCETAEGGTDGGR